MITDIAQLDPNGTYTYADYLTWQLDEHVELIRGKILAMSPTLKRMLQSALGTLSNLICNYLSDQRCESYVAPFDVRLPIQNKKKPEQIYTVVHPTAALSVS